MPKYNYSALDETYNELKISTDKFSENMDALINQLYLFINLDASVLNNRLEQNTKIYMQEVVIPAIQSIQIGVQYYTAIFKKMFYDISQTYESNTQQQIEKGDIVNLTTEGLQYADENNWKAAEKVNAMITTLNDQLYKVRTHGISIQNISPTAAEEVYNHIRHVLIHVYSIRLEDFSSSKAILELDEYFNGIDSLLDYVASCVREGSIVYEQKDRINNQAWYQDYEKMMIQSIVEIGVSYFVNRPSDFPLSSIEQNALCDLIEKLHKELDGDSISLLLNDPGKIKLFKEAIENFIMNYDYSGDEIPNKILILTQYVFVFSEAYEFFSMYEGYDKGTKMTIQYDPNMGYVITTHFTASKMREGSHDPIVINRNFMTGIPNPGKIELWISVVGPGMNFKVGPTTYNDEFMKFLLETARGFTGLPGQVFDATLGIKNIPGIVSYDQLKGFYYVYDFFKVHAIPVKNGNYQLEFIIVPSDITKNTIEAINKHYPEANISLEDLYTEEGLKQVNSWKKKLEEEIQNYVDSNHRDAYYWQIWLDDFLISGGVDHWQNK